MTKQLHWPWILEVNVGVMSEANAFGKIRVKGQGRKKQIKTILPVQNLSILGWIGGDVSEAYGHLLFRLERVDAEVVGII